MTIVAHALAIHYLFLDDFGDDYIVGLLAEKHYLNLSALSFELLVRWIHSNR